MPIPCTGLCKNRIFARARRKSSIPFEGSMSSSDFSELPLVDSDNVDSFSTYVSTSNNLLEGECNGWAQKFGIGFVDSYTLINGGGNGVSVSR